MFQFPGLSINTNTDGNVDSRTGKLDGDFEHRSMLLKDSYPDYGYIRVEDNANEGENDADDDSF